VLTIDKLYDKAKLALTRRSFMAGAGAAAAATTLAGCSNYTAPFMGTQTYYTDADILNYALNLEYAEAEFYLRAATGSGLASTDITAGSASPYQTAGAVTTSVTINNVVTPYVMQLPTTGPNALSSAQFQIVNEIAFEEQQHVKFLRAALGSAAVPRPALDLTFFGSLANVAGITQVAYGSGGFTPYDSFTDFLIGAFVFEDVGVTAYSGAAPLISAAGVASGYLTAAAGILAVEAYHAAYVRTALTGISIATGSNALLGVANKVEALRQTLTVGASGSVETALVLPTTSSTPSSIVAASASGAVAFARTVNQVHHIVYGNPAVGAKSGGFFPNGTNSVFATTTA
jgi:hypothetical protein